MPYPNAFVMILRALIFLAAPCCLCLAVLFFRIQFTFSYRKKNTARTAGILRETNHKKNVSVGIRRPMFVKDLTKARYVYTVNGVEYALRHTFYFTTKRQTPKFVPVVYNKRCPRFAYVDHLGIGDSVYGLWGVVFLAIGAALTAGIVAFFVGT